LRNVRARLGCSHEIHREENDHDGVDDHGRANLELEELPPERNNEPTGAMAA
jgi:hypothetical protein